MIRPLPLHARFAVFATGLVLSACFMSHTAMAHDESKVFREQAARRAGWDAVTRALFEAEALRDAGDMAGAYRSLGQARASQASDPRVLGFAARLALDEGRAREADSLASLALAGDRGARGALGVWRTRAQARAIRLDGPGALADYDHVIDMDPSRAEEHVIERTNVAWTLLGADAALQGLEARTTDGHWSPARRALAGKLARAMGQEPRERLASAGPEAVGRPALPLAAQAANDTLLRRGATWRWFAGPAAPSGAWSGAGYDDSAWGSGPAPLGYGETRIATLLPDGGSPTNRWITTYLRVHFNRAGLSPALTALLRADYDDGFIAWLNGVEVARRGLPLGPVVWSTLATNHESGAFETIALDNPALLHAGDNVLAIELHQTSLSSSDLLWDAELMMDTAGVALTRGPYLQNATPHAISVRWRTAAPMVGRVSVGPAGGPYALAFDEPAGGTEHEVRLTGLSPGMAYSYSVHGTLEAPAAVSESRTFRTPTEAGSATPLRLWAIGDSGYNSLGGQQVRDAYLGWAGAHREDFWLMLGDNAYTTGTDAEYQAGLFDEYPLTLSRSALWTTRGNHDLLYSGINNDYYDLFTLPTAGESGGQPSLTEAWYAFDWGPVHFVCLDSEGSSRALDSPMLVWLRADLASTTQPWVIGFWHHPPYTKGSHNSDDVLDSGGRMRDMRANVLPILDSLGVDLVLSGHSHSYERSSLLRGHYGTSGTLTTAMQADSGDGRAGGDGAYHKSPGPPRANEGTVYAVNGSAAQISGGTLDHPAMITSLNTLGSMVIDIDGDRLDARFLDETGAVRDSFSIVKSSLVSVPGPAGAKGIALAAARPSPFTNRTDIGFALAHPAVVTLAVYDVSGRRVRTLAQGVHAAGTHRATWDGRDEGGAQLAPGAYIVLLDADGLRRARRVVRLR